jgi:hypothetical protein
MGKNMPDLAVAIWRDGPTSMPAQPDKAKIRDWGTWVEGVINAFTSNGGLIYTSVAALNADLAHAQPAMAWVLGDPTTAYNGVYSKAGASGAGYWVRIADLPYSYILATDNGVGSENAIQATSSIPISASALVLVNVFEANTASPLTIQFNGGPVLTVKTNTGADIVPGGVVPGMALFGSVRGSTFRCINDVVSSAIVAAAQAAQTAAAASAALAAGYAAGLHLPAIFPADVGKTLSVDAGGNYQLIIPWDILAKTANYSAVDADHGKKMTLTGSSLFQLTFTAIANYRRNFLLFVMNEDTRGKVIQLGSQQPFMLWPGQSIIIVSGSNDWICHGRNQKFKLGGYNSIQRFYVDPINGAPSGPAYVDGLATSGPGCFKYVQDAINNLVKNCDANSVMPYIRVVNPISGEQVSFRFSGQMQGSCQITIEGGAQSGEDPMRWVATANNQTFVACGDNCILTLVHFDFDHITFTGGCCLNPSQNGVIDYQKCWFGPNIGGAHIFVDQGGSCNNLDSDNSYKVYGMATSSTTAGTYHIRMSGPSKYAGGGATVLMPNTLFCAAWLFIQGPACYNTGLIAFSGAGAGSGTTGAKYGIGYNGAAFLNASVLPGATAGSVGNGGVVSP